MIKINLDGKEILLSQKCKISDLLNNDRSFMCALVNNRLRQLDYDLTYDCTIKPLKLDDDRGVGVYKSTLRFLFVMACYNIYKDVNVKFSYNISRSFLASAIDGKKFNSEMKDNIEKEMKRLISLDLPITRIIIPRDQAIEIYKKQNMKDKLEIIEYRKDNVVHLNKCLDYYNYMYSYLLPSTGYIKNFELRLYENGILLRYPRSEIGGSILPFEDESTYAKSLKRSYKRAKLIDADNIYKINKKLEDPISQIEFINMCEARQNADLVYLADRILDEKSKSRLICIAGPSSSGKTTFSNRLRIQLMSRGIKPVKLSIDDYYISRDKLSKEQLQDLESIDIIDIPLLNEHLKQLIEGKEIRVPIFDFKTGQRKEGKLLKLSENQPIIIEGIHALNEKLTPLIPRDVKYKIYIAPHSQVNIDNHNPVSSNYTRLLRRLVRDNKYRGNSCEKTLAQWENVRNGEYKWIYENEEGVDYVYNSDLTYEVAVLKKHAIKLISKISKDSPYFVDANAIQKFLKYFVNIEDDLVPNNSLLREFIGGSCFKDV